jgi:hypothetical protein
MNIMNPLMSKILIFSITIFASVHLNAQEYKLTKSSGKLVLNLSGATIVGYEGKEIVIIYDTLTKDDEEPAVKNGAIAGKEL